MFDNKEKAAKRNLHSCVHYGAAQRIAHLSFFFLNFSPTMLSRLLILVVVATTAMREEKELRMT